MPEAEIADDVADFERTVELLGGSKTLNRPVRSRLEAHDLIRAGLPAPALDHLIREVAVSRILNRESVGEAVGISGRMLRKIKDASAKPLTREQGGRAWKFAEVFSRVTALVGSREAAEAWMVNPAMALDQRKPIDLLSTTAGVESVEEHLTRLEFSVYT